MEVNKIASLFDKKERSPLSVIAYSVFIITLMALNNNEKIRNIPSAYIFLRVIHIIFSIYIILKGIMLLKGTFKESQKRTLLEKIQIVFIVFLMILVVFVTIENILHTTSYASIFFNLV